MLKYIKNSIYPSTLQLAFDILRNLKFMYDTSRDIDQIRGQKAYLQPSSFTLPFPESRKQHVRTRRKFNRVTVGISSRKKNPWEGH